MKTTTPVPAPEQAERIEYTLEHTPWYFGAYLNQARHNMFLVFADISRKIDITPPKSEEDLLPEQETKGSTLIQLLRDKKADTIKIQKAMELLDRHLPYLYYMQYGDPAIDESTGKNTNGTHGKDNKTRNQKSETRNLSPTPMVYANILESLLGDLNDFRNNFSHYTAVTKTPADRKLKARLHAVFNVNIRMVKTDYKLEETNIPHLREKIDNKKNPGFHYHFADGDDNLTTHGLAFFICLFLTKGEAYLFLKKLKGFKMGQRNITDSEISYKSTLDAFCRCRLLPPREKIESGYSEQSLFLDMCSELAKCPAPLFELLSESDKNKFMPPVATSYETGGDEDEDTGNETAPKMVRKENRFVYFAQRYLDIHKALQRLRFGVDLGLYYYSIYPKEIAGTAQVRQLSKRLIGYGRLHDFDKEKRSEAFTRLAKTKAQEDFVSTEPYIQETNAHYHYIGENIPLYKVAENGEAFWPVIETSPTDGQKSYPNKLLKDPAPKPYVLLSPLEMPALLFYHLLAGESNAVESVIEAHINNTRRFFKDLASGKVQPVADMPMDKPAEADIKARSDEEYNRRYAALETLLGKYGLKTTYVPEKVVHHLLCLATRGFEAKAKQLIKQLISESQERIDTLKEYTRKENNRPGKKNFKKLKVGKMAQILAEDLLLFQPVAINKNNEILPASKANNTEYDVLQATLAYFGTNKDKLTSVFEACRLINSKNKHPFLYQVNWADCKGLVEFYESYFKKRKGYLENCLSYSHFDNLAFVRIKPAPLDITPLLEAYLNTNNTNHVPVNLPRGLFMEAVKTFFIQKGWALGAGNNRMVQTINRYFKEQLHDDRQGFYTLPRNYRLFRLEGVTYQPNMEEHLKALVTTGYITQIEETEKKLKKLTGNIKEEQKERDALQKLLDRLKENPDYYRNDYKYYLDNEKYLRLVEAQDMLLFICIQKMIPGQLGGATLNVRGSTPAILPTDFSLQNITPVNDTTATSKNLLDQTLGGGLGITASLSHKKNEKEVYTYMVKIYDDGLKIKNAGMLKKLAHDRRLPSLCYHFECPKGEIIEMHRLALENEFSIYERKRIEVLSAVNSFERLMEETYPEEVKRKTFNAYKKDYRQHRKYVEFTEGKKLDTGSSKDNLVLLRNAFLHNSVATITGFRIKKEDWMALNAGYKPDQVKEKKYYGIVEKMAAYAVEGYKKLAEEVLSQK